MTKTQNVSSSLLAVAIVALATSFAVAAPQGDVFSRPAEEKTTEAAKNTEAESSTAEQPTNSTVTKESAAKIDQQSDGWFTIVDDASMVELRLPGKPTYKEITFSPIAGRSAVVNHLYNSLINKQISVDYSWMDLHDAPKGKKLNDALDGAVKGAVVNVFGELTRMDKIKSGKINGREFDYNFPIQTPDGKTHMLAGRSRIFIQGNRQYQLNVVASQGKEDADLITKLFESLIIKGL